MDPLYLVDGSGYIFRAYYAVQPLSTSTGLPTNAVMGFTRMLTKLLRDVQAKYIAVAFDVSRETFRTALYPQYKANRKECPEDLVPQMPYFRKIVEAFGIRSLEKSGAEADDVIATITKCFVGKGQKIVIVSGDKDLTQLVDGDVQVWDAMRDIMFDRGKVREKFGVWPEQMVDYLALVGDASDNVPGVKGIGPKTAERLLDHFGSIEEMLKKSNEIGGLGGLRGANSIQQKIESAPEALRLSLELVRLKTDVEPFNQVAEISEFGWHQAKPDLIRPLFDELEFHSMRDVADFLEVGGAAGVARLPGRTNKREFTVVSPERLAAFAADLSACKEFAFDTETTSLDFMSCALLGISIFWGGSHAYYLPLGGEVETERHLDNELVLRLLKPIFADPQIRKIGFNLKFDLEVLAGQGIEVNGAVFDGMLCSHLLNPDRRVHGLKQLARTYLDEAMLTYEDALGGAETLAQVPLDHVADYACRDAEVSWKLRDRLAPQLGPTGTDQQAGLAYVFAEVEMPLVPVLAAMERSGIKVDCSVLAGLGREFTKDMACLESQIYELAGGEFNLNSPKQVAGVLFDRLKLPSAGIKKTTSGFSTDASVLYRLAEDYEIAARMLEYREVHKLNSTYIEALMRLVHPKTGRIHASFNQTGTATGRLSSSEPNLQNIPIRNPRGRRIREAFVAEEGCVLISADYSQIELRMLAHMSGDESLQEAFISGEDIHLRTAREIFGGALVSDKELKELRRAAKTINFGIIYGMGAFRLARELGVSRKQAQQYIENYFGRYPKVLSYFETLKRQADTLGYVATIFGRRRYAGALDTEGRDAGYAERSMINAPIQGSAAEVIKVAMINIFRYLNNLDGGANIVLQVHDELVVEVKESLAPEVAGIVVREMESAVQLAVPLKVDVRIHKCWGGEI